MGKEPLRSLSQGEIEARIRGLQFQVKRSAEEDNRYAAKATRLALELAGRGVDLNARKLAVNEPEKVWLN